MYGGEMDYQSMFTFMLEMAGTIAFAASGAMVGAQRGMDIFGVCVLGVVTAVGGGATRDIILGIVPPGMFQDPLYTIVATVTSCIVFAVMYWKQELLEGGNRLVYDKVMLVMDTVGLGVFTVMGVDKGGVPAMVIGTVVVILIRYLAAHYRWNLPRLRRE